MLDITSFVLVQDMAEKAGIDGVIEYWSAVGTMLAERIGEESYESVCCFEYGFKRW